MFEFFERDKAFIELERCHLRQLWEYILQSLFGWQVTGDKGPHPTILPDAFRILRVSCPQFEREFERRQGAIVGMGARDQTFLRLFSRSPPCAADDRP